MTTKKRVQFETVIHADAERVWTTMLADESYRQWTAAFSEGSYFEGDWQEGRKMRFLTPPGNGMLSVIDESRPHEYLSIRHIGFVMGGTEDTESEAVRSWAPSFENYTLQSIAEGTRLVIDQDVAEGYETFMEATWPKALAALKALCEED